MDSQLSALLERTSAELGVNLKPRFADKDISVGLPFLPSISARFTGVVEIPNAFLSFLTADEIRCLWLHEVAHVKLKHFLKDLAFSAALLSIAFATTRELFGGLLFLHATFLVGFVTLYFHRRFEFEADKFAAERVSRRAMLSTLEKIRRRYREGGLIYRISHPSLGERIRRLQDD